MWLVIWLLGWSQHLRDLKGTVDCLGVNHYYRAEVAYGKGDGTRRTADARVGEGVLWSADRQTAWRVQDGARGDKISLEAALTIAGRIGLPRVPGEATPPVFRVLEVV